MLIREYEDPDEYIEIGKDLVNMALARIRYNEGMDKIGGSKIPKGGLSDIVLLLMEAGF